MSATPPQQLEGTQAPSQIEFLWERYRRHFNMVVVLVLCCFLGYYAFKWNRQRELNEKWSNFAVSTGIAKSYTDIDQAVLSLSDSLAGLDLQGLERYLGTADANQAPYVLLAIARKAMQSKDWDRAEKAIAELETKYPKHSLVLSSEYPIQVRDPVKKDKPETDEPASRKKPELKDAKPGSAVSLLREQIAAARAFVAPAQFAKPEIPANAPKVKFDFGEAGSVTLALMTEKAPKHCEEFLKLCKKTTEEGGPFWVGLSVDEIQRKGSASAERPKQFHLGFESTKLPERDKWTKTDPSKNLVDEVSDLSHFEGAVAARQEADGKSCADRFWVCGEDAAEQDGNRVVFGYVVEGLDVVKKICESPMTAQEDESGIGVPTDKITVTAVTVLQ